MSAGPYVLRVNGNDHEVPDAHLGESLLWVLRERLGLPADSFRAVLIGKDGGAKITAAAPIAPQRLFATIDAMPMRRTEMRERR